MDNIFFDLKDLQYCGKNVIIGKTVRIRYPERVIIGDNCIIDDFTYISTTLSLTDNVHIASGCKIIGGKDAVVTMGQFSTLSPGVVLAAGSDDYTSGIATPFVPIEYKGDCIIGEITIHKHCIIGSNSVVLPNTHLSEGCAIGALSLVKGNRSYAPYCLYAGVPSKFIKQRDQKEIQRLEKKYYDSTI